MSQWQYNYNNPRGSEPSVAETDFSSLLEGLTKDELQELMDNEDKINELVCDQEKVRKIQLDIELIQAENRSLADHNIEKEPELEQLRETLTSKYNNLKQLDESFNVNQAKLASLQKAVNLEAMLAVLQAKCAVSEERSEELSEQVTSGQLAMDDFVGEYKACRTEAHMRRIKTDKMRELVLASHRHESAHAPPPPPSVPPRQPAAPYPGAPPRQPAGSSSYPGVPPRPHPAPYPGAPQQNFPYQQAAPRYAQPPGQQYPAYKWG